MYRKVPLDLLEGSRQGSLISWIALITMLSLFFMETREFLTPHLQTHLALDSSKEKKIRVNFNITMMDLSCEFATIDVFSVLGKEQNVTKNVRRWTVDADGVQQQYVHRNLLQHDIDLHDAKVTETLEELHHNGEDAIHLTPTTLKYALNENDFLFVDFYADWCSHCRALAPTWETLAEIMLDAAEKRVHEGDYSPEEYEQAKKMELPVLIAKVDCVKHHTLCMEQRITGYPTLRLFTYGERYGDFWGHRTILGFTQFLSMVEHALTDNVGLSHAVEAAGRRMNISEEERVWTEALEQTRHGTVQNWNPLDHPGCQLSGILLMDRAPGHFYIQAQSKSHDLAPHMTNVSHVVHELSFGDLAMGKFATRHTKKLIPGNLFESMAPMDGNVYRTHNLHEAYHHYLKLVSTNVHAYQVMQSSQLSLYRPDRVPEAKFIVDLSPISVSYRTTRRRWYDYITSVMAIIGGTFTVVGILESGIRRVSKQRRRNY